VHKPSAASESVHAVDGPPAEAGGVEAGACGTAARGGCAGSTFAPPLVWVTPPVYPAAVDGAAAGGGTPAGWARLVGGALPAT